MTSSNPDQAAAIAAAEVKLAEARAEVDRLKATLTDEAGDRQIYEHRLLTAADGRAEALRRYPGKAEGAPPQGGVPDGVAQGRAEAQRRAALRGGAA